MNQYIQNGNNNTLVINYFGTSEASNNHPNTPKRKQKHRVNKKKVRIPVEKILGIISSVPAIVNLFEKFIAIIK